MNERAVAERGRRRAALLVAAALLAAIAAVALFAFHGRYWKWRHDFNDQGRAYDAVTHVVYLEQAGLVWGGCAGLCGAGALLAAGAAWRLRRKR